MIKHANKVKVFTIHTQISSMSDLFKAFWNWNELSKQFKEEKNGNSKVTPLLKDSDDG